ncbi:hypothetical protein JDV02_010789 [Purpureocillium takamizusanense]|uniref:SPT2 chromatin protein n=1 Tax=Purpureocillium takamizusanense TaxID=2060973 RepID=A0A9Q8VFI8_9HYPO|nr:uncharacterized protein JDV02_010789 [Purpureocillium takamizusanense]UNI25085.1 hypothetical protein JDV02_010789 [Purpureocillium takamizusanense]
MPIGDLLAQITGDQSTAGSARTPTLPRGSQVPTKRKPDDDLRGNASKSVRHEPSQRPSHGSRPTSDRPAASHRSALNGSKPAPVDRTKSANAISKPARPAIPGARSSPNNTPAPVPAAPRAPPKKGSFAEILARGQRAQAVMGQVGKIQHKKVEKGAAARNKEDVKTPQPGKPTSAQAKGKQAAGYSGTSKAAPRNGTNGHRVAGKKDPRDTQAGRSKTGTSRREAEEEAAAAAAAAKKVKKAALVNTGYAGTARPKPAEAGHRKKETPRGGALLNAPISRGSSKRSRYEEDYDEELDDFIEYDDEEDEGGPKYGYESDGSSDMEAGLDELDVEERRAEYFARKEDIEEERLEKTLKAAKEDRKRKAMEELRARRR